MSFRPTAASNPVNEQYFHGQSIRFNTNDTIDDDIDENDDDNDNDDDTMPIDAY